MTPTEKGRRFDALYYGESAKSLAEMVVHREADLEELRAEFDKMDKWHSAELQAAMAENAKLRKYVAWLEKWALDHASFGLSADVQFELDMKRRDLGVEVDG